MVQARGSLPLQSLCDTQLCITSWKYVRWNGSGAGAYSYRVCADDHRTDCGLRWDVRCDDGPQLCNRLQCTLCAR